MAIDRTLEASLLKAVHSLNTPVNHIELTSLQEQTDEKLIQKIIYPQSDRLFSLAESLRRSYKIEELAEMTKIDLFFLDKIAQIVEMEEYLKKTNGNIEGLHQAKQKGFSDAKIAQLWHTEKDSICLLRKQYQLSPVFKMVDTCSGEFTAQFPYFYSTYETENESTPIDKPSVLILGAGPTQVGQGVEFDYTTVHAMKAVQKRGYNALLINDNPASLSTDFMLADKLYFSSLTLEDVYQIIEFEKPLGVLSQFGGKKAQCLGEELAYFGVNILGLPSKKISQLDNPVKLAANLKDEVSFQQQGLNFSSKEEIKESFISGRKCEVQAIYDGHTVIIPGVLEYIEQTDVPTGDSIAIYPSQSFSQYMITTLKDYTRQLVQALNVHGMISIQFVISDKQICLKKVSPYISRIIPFLSKITGVSMVEMAVTSILGEKISEETDHLLLPVSSNTVYVQAPAFSLTSSEVLDCYSNQKMKSTGAVMSTDIKLEKALDKAFQSTNVKVPEFGAILFAVNDKDKETALSLAQRFFDVGFTIVATQKTAAFFTKFGLNVRQIDSLFDATSEEEGLEQINHDDIQIIVYTAQEEGSDSHRYKIKRKAVEQGVTIFTSLDTLAVVLKVIQSRTFSTKEL
ncbi:hypothetical protein [Tetragenococcus muriaticus]|uniref:Carbamoyl phosphate synthase large subunit n=1 Tax=Tetragenococcus muriaticus 3MR10-3 TaxID=1302648 RepID=A0A091C2Y7_9ENTE|nr:carbamoyl phosphate synthase large subunit [Tetragenococcus muriaticus 3MR10-3]